MTPDAAVFLAGFVLAHAAWSISDVPKGELLVPLAVVETAGQRQILRFEAHTQAEAIAKGKAAIAARQAQLDAWAFAREGSMRDGTVNVDVITVDAWAKGMTGPITFVQRFSPYSSGVFRINGDAIVVVDGKTLKSTEASKLVQNLYQGVFAHTKAGPLWRRWQGK